MLAQVSDARPGQEVPPGDAAAGNAAFDGEEVPKKGSIAIHPKKGSIAIGNSP